MSRDLRETGNWRRARKEAILLNDGYCKICGNILVEGYPKSSPLSITVDHIIPISKGGDPFGQHNLQVVHMICNQIKKDKLPNDWRTTYNAKKAIDNLMSLKPSNESWFDDDDYLTGGEFDCD